MLDYYKQMIEGFNRQANLVANFDVELRNQHAASEFFGEDNSD